MVEETQKSYIHERWNKEKKLVQKYFAWEWGCVSKAPHNYKARLKWLDTRLDSLERWMESNAIIMSSSQKVEYRTVTIGPYSATFPVSLTYKFKPYKYQLFKIGPIKTSTQ